MKSSRTALLLALSFFGSTLFNSASAQDASALKDAVVLVIRHAEKPETGSDLTPEGVERAKAYIHYFENFQVDDKPLKLDTLFATHDSKRSNRPRLTLEPLSHALNLPLDSTFKNKEFDGLVEQLKTKTHGTNILICWHHGEIPALITALGADPSKLLPDGKWPDAVFGWVIELRFDHDGHIDPAKCKRVNEALRPGDTQ